MGESNELFDFGGMKSSVGPVGGASNSWGQVNLPKAIGGVIMMAGENGLVIVGLNHVTLCEGGNAVSITELANGEKRGVDVVKDETLCGCSGEAQDWKGSNGVGKDGSVISTSTEILSQAITDLTEALSLHDPLVSFPQ